MDIVTLGAAAGALIGVVFKIIRDENHDKKAGNGALLNKIEEVKKEIVSVKKDIISEVKEVDKKVEVVVSKQSQMEGICSQARGDFAGQIKGLDEKIFEHMRDHHNIGGRE